MWEACSQIPRGLLEPTSHWHHVYMADVSGGVKHLGGLGPRDASILPRGGGGGSAASGPPFTMNR